METLDPVALINEAISARNWPLLVVAILLIVAPIVMHLVGKQVPLVSSILNGAVSLFRKPKPAVSLVPPPEEPKGVAGVVEVVDEKKP
jgi:hypothetical protein